MSYMGRSIGPPSAEETEQAWQSARAYAVHLARGGAMPQIAVTGLILDPGEQAVFQTGATYERLYAGDGSYSTVGVMALGRPAFVVGAVAATLAVNARRRRRAADEAAVTWRDRHETMVLATDRRLLIGTANHGWLSFWFAGITEFYPEPQDWTVAMVWRDASPLRLSGLAAPYLAAHVAARVMPSEWLSWPQMQRLLG